MMKTNPAGRSVAPWLQPGIVSALVALVLGGCATPPLTPYSADGPPLIMLPASQAGIDDRRGRFREVFCAVLDRDGPSWPDYRACDEALTTVGDEPAGSGRPVDLGHSTRGLKALFVPGVGWDCFSEWLDINGSAAAALERHGFDTSIVKVDSLSGSARNGRQIRDAVMQMPQSASAPNLVLVGYSKGATDILEAVVNYPEIRPHIAAVVSTAGSVGGSPLANDAQQHQLKLLTKWPGAQCTPGDGGALDSLRPATRQAWLARHTLPDDMPYFSLVTYPSPERISSILVPSYNKLSRIDSRNDSQVLFYDQLIPGSRLLGFLNADHWALAVPIARSHEWIGSTFVDQNDFPREALLEALLRFIEEDLGNTAP